MCVCVRTWVQVLTKVRRGRPRILVNLLMWVLRRAVCTLGHHGISLAPIHAYSKTGTLKSVLVLLRLEILSFCLVKGQDVSAIFLFFNFPSYPPQIKICIRVSFGCFHARGTFYTHSWSLSLFTGLCLKYNVNWVLHASHGPGAWSLCLSGAFRVVLARAWPSCRSSGGSHEAHRRMVLPCWGRLASCFRMQVGINKLEGEEGEELAWGRRLQRCC